MKRILRVSLIALALFALTGCSKSNKPQEAFEAAKAQAQAQVTVIDDSAGKPTKEVLIDRPKQEVPQTEAAKDKDGNGGSGSSGGAEGTGETIQYVINTDTLHIHLRNCEIVDMKVPTFQVYKGTLDMAASQGYTKCAMCFGYTPRPAQ